MNTPVEDTKKPGLIKALGKRLHSLCFFAPGISRLTWPVLGWFFRNRPCVATLDRAINVEGDVLECGVFWGRSAITLARKLKKHGQTDKKVFALDSFDGFGDESVHECDLGEGRTAEVAYSRFRQDQNIVTNLRNLSDRLGVNVEVVPGYFENTLPAIVANRVFSYVHLDCDIYSSYKTCLPLVYGALAEGGVIVFDEYNNEVWPGATQAIDEFFADKPEKPELVVDPDRPNSPKYFVVKAKASQAVLRKAA